MKGQLTDILQKNRADRKKYAVTALLLAAALFLVSCSGIALENKTEQVEGYTEAQAMIVVANERNRYQSAYTDAIWSVEVPERGVSFDKLMIQNVKSFLEQVKLLCMLAGERGITVTSQERDELRQLSETYLSGLSEADQDYIGCSREDVQAVYTDYFLANKLVRTLTAGVNNEISDSEAKVIRIQQIVTSSLPKAKALLKRVKIDGAEFGSTAGRYSEAEETERTLSRGKADSLFEQTAFSLEEGQISNIIAQDGLYYIIKCTDDYDQEATQERKSLLETAINNRTFQEVYGPYKEEHNIRFPERFWNRIDLTAGNDSTVENFFELYEEAFSES